MINYVKKMNYFLSENIKMVRFTIPLRDDSISLNPLNQMKMT